MASGCMECERTRCLLGGSTQVHESAKIWPNVSSRKNPRWPARSLPREKGKRRDDQLLAPGRAGTITLARIKLDDRKDPGVMYTLHLLLTPVINDDRTARETRDGLSLRSLVFGLYDVPQTR